MFKKLAFALFLCLASLSAGAVDFPYLSGQVVDEAGILTSQTKQEILALLKPQQQFVVVTLKSLRGMEIEEYGVALGRYWGIGDKEKSDGVLLIVAPNERQTRIEVGYGLEGVLTDAKCSLIVQNVLLPAFRKGDYNAGVLKASKIIIELIDGKQVDIGEDVSYPWVVFFVFLFWGIIAFLFLYLNRTIPPGNGHGGFYRRGFHGSSGWSSAGSFRGGGGSFGGGGASGKI